ncbi:putative nuclease HARBI1 [Mercenaria mercenaria]|uniref:putative nuclease HARBI1 n=1 Tax=Mercenaria mercenaria TaxID=6596 RepID=UPI00234F375B|nr:putative nuclease HARBI1 [Mercenaria mercenaria]
MAKFNFPLISTTVLWHLVELVLSFGGKQWQCKEKPTVSHQMPVLTGLRYLAKGDFLSEVADLNGVSRSSACHIIDSFVEAVNDRLDSIRFEAGLLQDGTLIPIIAPSQNEEVYVCRKNYHAINVQAVVDHRARFIDLVAKWPGSTHDASIFDNCGLKDDNLRMLGYGSQNLIGRLIMTSFGTTDHLERHELGHLLGDSGYPLRKYLITPVTTATTEKEVRFNQAHSSGRMVVERAFGMLKSRFRCLHRTGVLYKSPGKCYQIVTACTRLHNFC